MDFEWDLKKEKSNERKHGCSFTEAIECFKDPNGIQLVDRVHSVSEKRFFWIGKSANGRVLTIWFTKRGKAIRIIGCAEWRKFRRFYHETTKAK